MKRILFFAFVLTICTLSAVAQSRQVAVLKHDGQYSNFYGTNGLRDAINVAVDGDEITLSPGHFTDVTIKRAITVKGSRMSNDITKGTRIGSMIIEPYPDSISNITVENIYISDRFHVGGRVKVADVSKCRFGCLTGNPYKINLTGCEIYGMGNLSGFDPKHANILNSVIVSDNRYDWKDLDFNLVNCVLNCGPGIGGVYKNCIFLKSLSLWHECSASGCKYVGETDKFFEYVGGDNECAPVGSQVFIEGSFYELTPEYATLWLGNDGTQAGIYGGPAPFTTDPSNPFISKFEIDHETSPDGKLNIKVEITNPRK